MACESNVNRPNILPERKETEKKKENEGNEGNEGKCETSITLQLNLIFLVVLFIQPSLSVYKNRVPINCIDGPLKSLYNVSIWYLGPPPHLPHPCELHNL